MAMNEDSVVSSLNELRRMANDRARRETEARARVEERSGWDQRGHGGRRSDGRIRATEIHGAAAGYPDAAGHAPTLMGGHAVAGRWQPEGQATQGGYGYGHTAQPPAVPESYSEPVRQKSAVGPVLLTILLLGGAAGGGYWKLQQDWQATLRARDAAILSAEEGRNRAVELAARAEQLAKVQIAAAELRAKTAAGEKPSAAPAPAPAASDATPASAPKTVAAAPAARPGKVSKRGHARAAGRRPATPPPWPPPLPSSRRRSRRPCPRSPARRSSATTRSPA
jgi:hypothetical protein